MFVDDGFSGVSFVRPFFAEMMQLADTGEARTIIVKDHSRLSRNYLVIGGLMDEFLSKNIRYIAITDSIDTANGLDDLLPMRDLFNEWHVRETSKKVLKEVANISADMYNKLEKLTRWEMSPTSLNDIRSSHSETAKRILLENEKDLPRL